ncbi:hypothetical protein BDW02DRAFT_579887 [Decorospora gaudefroyi]|uniref:RING-type domain-containing protein n=1 Tax=Decorospora gaudefroyi TaxID=184978 RepID=A0A6A5KEW8_9PLEO|nr:hypothetical protein BDW02DRAFT_579887 [Decorospora gaudefroyi]
MKAVKRLNRTSRARDGDTELPMELPCGHVFGEACIAKWIATKNTCPLCRAELSDAGRKYPDDDYEDYNTWGFAYVSARQTFGTSLGHGFVPSFVPEYPWEEVTLDDLGLSPAHRSRSFETHAGRHQEHARQASHRRLRQGSRQPKAPTPSYVDQDVCITPPFDEVDLHSFQELEDIWITPPFSEEMNLTSFQEPEDIWITVLDHSDDMELPLPRFQPELSLGDPGERNLIPDCSFEDLLVEHTQWMDDLSHDMEFEEYDMYDYLV